jgi:hydroxymethylpyrimidine pyrophosphatase-like HAD family hydrolase
MKQNQIVRNEIRSAYDKLREFAITPKEVDVACCYKLAALGSSYGEEEVHQIIHSYLRARSTTCHRLALDFDGTIIPIENREAKIRGKIKSYLKTLLSIKGHYLLLASGRGKSLRVQADIFDNSEKSKLFLAMYNGALIFRADYPDKPIFDRRIEQYEALLGALDVRIGMKLRAKDRANTEFQIRLRIPNQLERQKLLLLVTPICDKYNARVTDSGYSIDVGPKDITKQTAVSLIEKTIGGKKKTLRLGDQGAVGGNDFEMLNFNEFTFSVGTLSTNLKACFPVVSNAGLLVVGPQGTAVVLHRYLKNALNVNK